MIDSPSKPPRRFRGGNDDIGAALPQHRDVLFLAGRGGDGRVGREPAGGQGDQHAGVVPVRGDDDPVRVGHRGLPQHLLAPGIAEHPDAAVAGGRLDVAAVVSTTTMWSAG